MKRRYYHIKPELLSNWGSETTKTAVVDDLEIERLSRDWDVSIDELMQQVEEIPGNPKLYVVSFDTQRNRVYSNWEYIALCNSKKAAVEEARAEWEDRGYHSHQFHCCAERIDALPQGREIGAFKRIDWRPVTWGCRG